MKKNKNSAALSDEDRAKASGGAWVNLGKVNPSGSREKIIFVDDDTEEIKGFEDNLSHGDAKE